MESQEKMTRIENETCLVERLLQDVQSCPQEEIVFFAGHAPLLYRGEPGHRFVELGLSMWGPFSLYSLKLAAQLASEARAEGKTSRFAICVDDHTYSQGQGSYWRKPRKRFYDQFSWGKQLPSEYHEILRAHRFSEQHVIKQLQGRWKKECLLISENQLLHERQQRNIDAEINECALSYREFVETPTYFDKSKQYLVSFIPNRCMKNVCCRVLDKVEGVEASHVFTHTEETFDNAKVTVQQLYNEWGVLYRKDEVQI
jgi:hypothetical protein